MNRLGEHNGHPALPPGREVGVVHARSAPPSGGPWGAPPTYCPPAIEQRAALAEVYAGLEAALAPWADRCRACGDCCRFKPGGVILFAGALEMAYLVAEAGPPAGGPVASGPPDEAWRCPYQEGDLCGARGARPLGCRTYFCDDRARGEGERLYAGALREIQKIAQGQGAGWWYGPARAYLGRKNP